MKNLSSSLARLGVVGSTALVVLVSCGRPSEQSNDARPTVIYGDDNRYDVFQFSNNEKMKELSRSTAALIDATSMKQDSDGFVRMETTPYGESMGLCRSEPFYNQPTGPWCSGFLVAPDVLVTAGHCVRSESSCKTTAFVFGFGYEHDGDDIAKVPSQNVYSCAKLIKQELSGGMDFAVVKLDRPVTDRKPLKVRREGSISLTDAVTVIGHPSGLPTKITDKGSVRSVDNPDFFVTELDTYGGNSGSAVFNSATGEVEGILVRGERDFAYSNEGCRISYKCEHGTCRGEDVSRAAQFVPYIPASVADTPVQ